MPAADKLRLRKELEKHYGFVNSLTRGDLPSGKWFVRFMERTLASYASAPTPPEIQARFPGREGPDDLADAVTTAAIHEAIGATDAYEENLTGTEIRNLREKKPSRPDERLSGDSVALMAELCHTVLIDINLCFDLAAAYSKQLNAAQTDLLEEIFGKALGSFDWEAAKAEGDLGARIGAKIFDRAIVQALGSDLGEAQRKGFYCYYAKAISKEARKVMERLPAWEPPKAETGPMGAAAAEDEGTAFAT